MEKKNPFQWWKVYITGWTIVMMSIFYYIHLQNVEIANMFNEIDIEIIKLEAHTDSIKIEGDRFVDSLRNIKL